MKKKLIYLIIILVIIGASAAGFYFLYSNVSSTSLSYSIDMIQENLNETANIKYIGDLLIANKKNLITGYNWTKIQAIAANSASQLGGLSFIDSRLDGYKIATTAWTVKIREAAKEPKTWKDVPANPGNFTVALRDSEAEDLLNNSLAKIFELNLFGSDAIRRKDKVTMRYIAAKLLVQDHWLSGLANYKKSGIFSNLIKPAYAQANGSNKVKYEYERVQASILAFKNFALAYYYAENNEKSKTAADGWKKATEDWAKAVAESDLAPQVLAELMKDAKIQSPEQEFIKEWAKAVSRSDLAPQVLAELMKNAETQSPPQVQGFKDNCLASGGKLAGVNRNNGWIPTGEDGYYCNFKEQDKDCWDFLSYTGDFSAGGNSGCVMQNVLDQATGPNSTAVNAKGPAEPAAPATTSKVETPKAPAKAPAKTPLRDLGTPTGTAAPKIEFVLSQNNFTATVGENFSYSFCQPAVTRNSDLCTAASTNPRYGLPPYSFSLDSGGFLPLGLTLNLNGLLVGAPTAEGSRTVGICAKDTGGFSICRSVTINVKPAPAKKDYDIYERTECVLIKNTTTYSWQTPTCLPCGSSYTYFTVQDNILYVGNFPYQGPLDSSGMINIDTGNGGQLILQRFGSGKGSYLKGTNMYEWGGTETCTYSITAERNDKYSD